MPKAPSLRAIENIGELGASKSGRLLQAIRRDMDLTRQLMLARRRNEDILSLAYRDGDTVSSSDEWENLREHSLNLPWRQVRWMESQATSKKMIVRVNRDAGSGQRPGGPADTETGMWLGITLGRVAYEAGYQREMKALISEIWPRGTSVLAIGYHEQAITFTEASEVGKDTQSVIADVLGEGDLEAKPGQAHAEISTGLANIAADEMFQLQAGSEGVNAVLERKASHDQADYEEETDQSPIYNTRLIRRKIWLRKRRVGEDVGWAPWVYDTEDTPFWWDRQLWTVAEVKRSDLFSDSFKRQVRGFDARNLTGLNQGGYTESTEQMGSDARIAQSEDILDDDERVVEVFMVWMRRPDMKSGGIRKIVCAEVPDEFVESDERNPHVDENGFGLIPGFYPFYDFTPFLSSKTIPERTKGIPPVAPGMTQFEKIAEGKRLVHESALRHSLRVYQGHPALKEIDGLENAIRNGDDGYFFFAPPGMVDTTGKMQAGVSN